MNLRVTAGTFGRVITAHYFDFHGRAGRAEFWNYIAVFAALTMLVEVGVHVASITALGMTVTVWSVGCFLPTIGVTIRRLHDLNRSGWWLVAPLIPAFLWSIMLQSLELSLVSAVLAAAIIGVTAYLIYLCVQPGTAAANRYGPAPQLAHA